MLGRRSQQPTKRKAAEALVTSPKTPANPPAVKMKYQKTSTIKAKKSLKVESAVSRKKKIPVNQTTVDDQVFKVGDHVYVVVDEALCNENLDEEEDDLYQCGICSHGESRLKGKLLECSKCLGGFHLKCLDPPLKEIPEGDWVCPHCEKGKAPRRMSVKCACARFLAQKGIAVARIVNIWLDTTTNWVNFTAQWYYLPEETHFGRQRHHMGREVFLSRQYDAASIESILRHANVISMNDYNSGAECTDDTFICDYEYDPVWQRFRRYAPWDALGEVDDDWDEPAAPGLSDDEDHDGTFTMMDALVEEHGEGIKGRGKAGRKKKQGGKDFKSQLGTRQIPEHVRDVQHQQYRSAALTQACHALTLAATPHTLPCRESEHQQITTFVEGVLADRESGKGSCLYISGIPGTGKTATVLQVMRQLRERAQAGEVSKFQFVDINGLRLPSPQHVYSTLYEALTGEVLGPQSAATALEDFFAKPRRSHHHTVVLLDEVDSLVNRTQTVLYNLFDWPSRPGSNLTIIGIANTMDLPERLHPRIGSRLAGNRLVFHPYQCDQLITIMNTRLGESAFDGNAIKLIARKVANCSGDVRRSLELCRRAAEIATKRHISQEAEGDVRVTIKDANSAITEAFNTPHTNIVRNSSRLERLLLAAIHLESRHTGTCEVILENVASRLTELCENKEQPYITVLQCAVSLAASKIILCDAGHRRLKANVALNIPTDDLLFVLTNDQELTHIADRLK